MDRDSSTADVTEAGVQLCIQHVSDPALKIDLHYSGSGGGTSHPLGFEEYYRLQGEPPTEHNVLDDLAEVLASTYLIEETLLEGPRHPYHRQGR